MNYLLDTNILSETIRPQPNPAVMEWMDSMSQERFYISVLTIGEIRKGIVQCQHQSKQQQLLQWLETKVIPWFQSQILPIDITVAEQWALLQGKAAQPIPAIDGLLAATAQTHNLTMVTRNVSDFVPIHPLSLILL